MLLIGGQKLNPTEGDYTLIAAGFRRLPRRARHTGRVTRFVGYESVIMGDNRIRFFGIEVDAIEDIPDGMVAWELGDKEWTIRASPDDSDVVTWREDIRWEWLDRGASGSGRWTGEFRGRGPAEWSNQDSAEPRTFRMTTNAYIDVERSGFQDDVYLVDYDPSWPEQFERMARWLRNTLGPDVALRVEHYGSTAIPGMPAKPIVDILVEVPSFLEAKERVLPRLNEETWEYWWYSDHMVFFKRKELMGERTCHVHLAPRGHRIWEGIVFRDYLRSHPEDAAKYAEIKIRLAESHRDDREEYTNRKTEFVRQITVKALAAFGGNP
jgi:GrpB-like predicted nucleotidyltransferase (UPF0157 family)